MVLAPTWGVGWEISVKGVLNLYHLFTLLQVLRVRVRVVVHSLAVACIVTGSKPPQYNNDACVMSTCTILIMQPSLIAY